ncbi:MAG TPA: NUDIX hydrolase [Acidobacteriota bacterium]|nr:NUDIX hydrolase [Acidobacteriota bacterium]
MTQPDPGHYRFCPLCATELVLRPDGDRPRLTCPRCAFIYYHNPVPAAGGVIFREEQICLVRRAVPPRVGDWTLPAGFLEYEETSQECAVREIAEETGLRVAVGDLLGVYMGFDDSRQHALLIVYWVDELGDVQPVAGDDAAEVGFFAPAEIPANIAFRAHREALRDVFAHSRFRAAHSTRAGHGT